MSILLNKCPQFQTSSTDGSRFMITDLLIKFQTYDWSVLLVVWRRCLFEDLATNKPCSNFEVDL